MKLTQQQIIDITTGYCSYKEENGALRFCRMSKSTAEGFIWENKDHDCKVRATAGIKIDFRTDSAYIAFSVRDVRKGSSRKFWHFDVYVNGELYLHAGEKDYETKDSLACKASLDGNLNRIEIFFPYTVNPALESMELSDGAILEPVKAPLKALCYGDSITHGYDARFPSQSYVNVMARKLNCEIVNQAIGGAMFNAKTVDAAGDYKPDFVTIAYGTNDWAKRPGIENLCEAADAFFKAVSAQWKGIPVFVILPIWRGNYAQADKPTGDFLACRQRIAAEAEKYDLFHVVDDFDLVPHSPDMFSPDVLHPNDAGFAAYGNRLADFIAKTLGL